MNNPLSTPDVAQQTIIRLRQRRRELLRFGGLLLLCFGLAGLVRAMFPAAYVFRPLEQGWLLIPEALVFGPLVAIMHHRILAPGTDFAWSRDNLLLKSLKAAVYYYVLLILFKAGIFAVTQVVPALIGFLLGPTAGPLFPIIVGVGGILFLLVYVRLLLVYPFLAGEERQPLINSMVLSRGKARQIVSCLLLLAAPVLIPWVAAQAYGGQWLDPTHGPGIRIVPLITRSVLQTAGAIVISTGLCVIYEALVAAEGDSDQDS